MRFKCISLTFLFLGPCGTNDADLVKSYVSVIGCQLCCSTGPLIGLVVIAIGTGGIKPCVSAFAGDQFTPKQVMLLILIARFVAETNGNT